MQTILGIGLIALAVAFVFATVGMVVAAGAREGLRKAEEREADTADDAEEQPADLDEFSAVLLEESRTMIRECYTEAGVSGPGLEYAMQHTIRKMKAEWTAEPPWRSMVPRLVEEARPMIQENAQDMLAIMRSTERGLNPPPEGWQ